jgi:hypothetical protein
MIVIGLTTLAGCDSGPESARGFTLPDGDAESGRTTYLELQCNACHTIADIEQISPEREPDISVALGGKVTSVRTYGELVTSIINPSHRLARGYPAESIQTEDGQSKMKNYNDVMTVSELIDLVKFLQSNYSLRQYEPTHYPIYRIF